MGSEPVWPLLVLVLLIIGTLLLPPHLDPAIRLKEWMERRR
jgi:hypothetical protein